LLQSWYCALVHEVEHADVGLRERKKQRTRELIAGTALRLFAQRGYAQTTVADVAAAAEVSERTVFSYFATKEDLLFSDQIALEQGLSEALAERPDGVGALDVLRDFIVESLGDRDERERLRWQIVCNDDVLHAHLRSRQANLLVPIAAAIATEVGEEVDDLRPQLVAAAVVAAITATFEHRYRARSRTASRAQAVAVIDEAIAFLRGGLDAIRSFPKPY
jgi:AcrR family transcriptional regulator